MTELKYADSWFSHKRHVCGFIIFVNSKCLNLLFFFFKFISVVRVNERELNFITISSIIGSARIKVKL